MAKIMINRQFVAKISIKYFEMTRKVFTHVHLTSLVYSAQAIKNESTPDEETVELLKSNFLI